MRKSFRNQVGYDIRIGIGLEWKKYFGMFAVFLSLGFMLSALAESYQIENLRWTDYLIKIFEGTQELQRADRTASFYIPKEWLLVQFLFLLHIAGYPKRDLETRGIQILVRSQSKCCWWLSKCIWLLLSTILYYIVFYTAIAGAAYLNGAEIGGGIRVRDIWQIGIMGLTQKEGQMTVFLMPCLCTAAIGMVQMLLSVIFSPVPALCVSIAYLVLAVAVKKSWILGNYTMLVRNGQITEGGVENSAGVVAALCLIAFCIITGMGYMKKKELLQEGSRCI